MSKGGNSTRMASRLRAMSVAEQAYVGAMIDGEGCVSAYAFSNGKKSYNYPRVVVVNNEPELISALLRATGIGAVNARPSLKRDGTYDNWTFCWRLDRQNEIEGLAQQCAPFSIKLQKALV